MAVGEINALSESAASLRQSLQTTQPPAASPSTTSADRSYVSVADSTITSRGSNLLSSNFVNASYKQSTYVSSLVSGLHNEKTFGDRMGSLLSGLSAQFDLLCSSVKSADDNPQYIAAYLMHSKIEDGVKGVTQQEIADQSADNLADLTQNIEDQAAQSSDTSSTDGNAAKPSGGTTAAQEAPAASGTTAVPSADQADAVAVPSADQADAAASPFADQVPSQPAAVSASATDDTVPAAPAAPVAFAASPAPTTFIVQPVAVTAMGGSLDIMV